MVPQYLPGPPAPGNQIYFQPPGVSHVQPGHDQPQPGACSGQQKDNYSGPPNSNSIKMKPTKPINGDGSSSKVKNGDKAPKQVIDRKVKIKPKIPPNKDEVRPRKVQEGGPGDKTISTTTTTTTKVETTDEFTEDEINNYLQDEKNFPALTHEETKLAIANIPK